MNDPEDFGSWFDRVGLDRDYIDDIVVLYDDILRGFSEDHADIVVSETENILSLVPADPELLPFRVYVSEKLILVRWLDALYPDNGGVHGEESYLHNMARDN